MYQSIKRILDFILSLLAIIVLSPLLLVLAILVRINLGAPVLFKQKRVGRYNKIFKLYKFRSMRMIYDKDGNLLPDEKRMTKFGAFLRRSSLDELPQLFNILFGQMTIIGPRPRMIYETMLMKDTKFIYRMAIKPGLSSWSVIHGRNNMRIDQALAYDFEHVIRYSFLLDVKIFFKTIAVVLKRSGINTEGYVTTKPISEFLIENKIKTPEEIEEIKTESKKIDESNEKFLPLGITKEDFINKRKKIKKFRESFDPQKAITWN